jgi:redox-sensing transcriptional repressor
MRDHDLERRHPVGGSRASLPAKRAQRAEPSLTVGLLPRSLHESNARGLSRRFVCNRKPAAFRGSLRGVILCARAHAMKRQKISELTTNRLSVYLRCLNDLTAAGIKTVSSQELAEQFNLNSAQIRKDLGYFGEFGVRGTGYFIEDLRKHLTKILGLDRIHHVGIVGAGRLGTALANYNGLAKSSFAVVAVFDNDNEKIGETIGPSRIPIYDVKKIAKVVKDQAIDVAVIAVPARAAQRVLNQIMAAGVKAVLNFAPAPLVARHGVKVKTVDLTTSLESLSYFLARPETVKVTNARVVTTRSKRRDLTDKQNL